MQVLVTGAFGWTAAAIVKAIKHAGHQVVAFDLPTAHCSDEMMALFDQVVLGSVAVFEDVYGATQSIDAIIHLAVAIQKDDYQKPAIPFSVNVQGAYHVFESARQRGISKIVLMSEAAVHIHHAEGEHLHAVTDWRSSGAEDHLYDLTKRLQEEIARDFCSTYPMNTVVLRAGHIVDGRLGVDPAGRALSTLDYCRGGWICRYDLATACVKSLHLSTPGYIAFHVIGATEARQHFDIERTETELGFVFATRFEQYYTLSPH